MNGRLAGAIFFMVKSSHFPISQDNYSFSFEVVFLPR